MQVKTLAPERKEGSNLFIVAVDESHGDSHDAFLAARSFAKKQDFITLFSVVPKTEISEEKKDHLIKTFVNYADHTDQVYSIIAPASDTESVAQVFVKEAKAEDASMLFMGCGSKLSHGSLGSVTDELLRLSKRSICCVKPGTHLKPAKAKDVVFAFHGSEACKSGLAELLPLLSPELDSLKVVTVSHHEGDKDKANLALAREMCAGSAMKIDFEYVARAPGNSVGFELITFADKLSAELLVVSSWCGKEPRLGSTSAYVCTHGTTSVMVMKASQPNRRGSTAE